MTASLYCPASQSDVSVYGNLLFVSGEGLTGRLDCGAQGVRDTVSTERLRGLRIFDISDIRHPRNVGNVQTCRGSHTHTVLEDPNDRENVYVYISGSAGIRSPNELPGCVRETPDVNPNSALFRIEVIKVPLAHPERAAIVSSPRIFNDLVAPPRHGEAPDDIANAQRAIENAKRSGQYVVTIEGQTIVVPPQFTKPLLDISDPVNPRRIGAVADSNFSYWHSATFNNDGTKVLFSDEWGGGGGPKCRASDPKAWGADALFTIADRQMQFQSYYKMPAAQTAFENCVAHNGSLIPVPGRDIMVQSWYQGGISVFDWTDGAKPVEIAFHDRGPVDSTRMVSAGSWSVYWYNGLIVSSEIARGLDVFELQPSAYLTKNEIDAANTVRFDHLNPQGQPKITWPASFALSRAYVDQLERSRGLTARQIADVRAKLAAAEAMSGAARSQALHALGTAIDGDVGSSGDEAKVKLLAGSVHALASAR